MDKLFTISANITKCLSSELVACHRLEMMATFAIGWQYFIFCSRRVSAETQHSFTLSADVRKDTNNLVISKSFTELLFLYQYLSIWIYKESFDKRTHWLERYWKFLIEQTFLFFSGKKPKVQLWWTSTKKWMSGTNRQPPETKTIIKSMIFGGHVNLNMTIDHNPTMA